MLYDETDTTDAELIVVAFGSAARIAFSAVKQMQKEGLKVGLFRPITLFPFPEVRLKELAEAGRCRFLTIELNNGQMVEDVRLAVNGKTAVEFYGRPGGAIMNAEEIYEVIKKLL
ncbi:MAG: hypothetical protein L3V56_01375 [Candidatus Magnetoovum sp. WYHC-5]|nr:hypothetical protein [Candidatus Magnetoovum sp. WYHC-5]